MSEVKPFNVIGLAARPNSTGAEIKLAVDYVENGAFCLYSDYETLEAENKELKNLLVYYKGFWNYSSETDKLGYIHYDNRAKGNTQKLLIGEEVASLEADKAELLRVIDNIVNSEGLSFLSDDELAIYLKHSRLLAKHGGEDE